MDILRSDIPLMTSHHIVDSLSQIVVGLNSSAVYLLLSVHSDEPCRRVTGSMLAPLFPDRLRHHDGVSNFRHRIQESAAGT